MGSTLGRRRGCDVNENLGHKRGTGDQGRQSDWLDHDLIIKLKGYLLVCSRHESDGSGVILVLLSEFGKLKQIIFGQSLFSLKSHPLSIVIEIF